MGSPVSEALSTVGVEDDLGSLAGDAAIDPGIAFFDNLDTAEHVLARTESLLAAVKTTYCSCGMHATAFLVA